MKRKILVLSAHPPLKRSREAGQKVFFENIKELNKNFDIHIVTFARDEELDWGIEEINQYCKSIEVIKRENKEKIRSFLRKPWLPIIYHSVSSKQFVRVVKKLLKEEQFDVVHFEWGQMSYYTNLIDNIQYKTVMNHDVISQMYERKFKNTNSFARGIFYKIQTILSRKFENNKLVEFSKIYCLNSKDKMLIENTGMKVNVTKINPHFENPNIKQKPNDKKNYDLVYFGAMNRIENQDAVLWFCKEILPIIEMKYPNIKVLIVGNNPSEYLKKELKNLKNVKLTGFVDDPISYIKQSKIGIVPLRLGAGIKIKTLELMACGLPVITTEVGAEGIDNIGNSLLITKNKIEFANYVISLISNEESILKYGKHNMDFINKNYKFEESSGKFAQSLSDLFH